MRQIIIVCIFFFSSKNGSLLINFFVNLFFILIYLLQIAVWIFGETRRLLLNLSESSFFLYLCNSILIKIRNVHVLIINLCRIIQRILLFHYLISYHQFFIRLFFVIWCNLLNLICVIRFVGVIIKIRIPEFLRQMMEPWLS